MDSKCACEPIPDNGLVLVSSGSYSNYCPDAVFLSLKDARDYADDSAYDRHIDMLLPAFGLVAPLSDEDKAWWRHEHRCYHCRRAERLAK